MNIFIGIFVGNDRYGVGKFIIKIKVFIVCKKEKKILNILYLVKFNCCKN